MASRFSGRGRVDPVGHTHDDIFRSGPPPISRSASLLPTTFRHGGSGLFSTVDSAAAVPDYLNVLDARELLREHSKRAQPTALDDE